MNRFNLALAAASMTLCAAAGLQGQTPSSFGTPAVVVCERGCASGEVAATISERVAEHAERWSSPPPLRWKFLPEGSALPRVSPRATCADLASALIDLNRTLVSANRTVHRIENAGYYFAVGGGRTVRVARGDRAYASTLDRWRDRAAGHAVGQRIFDAWSSNGCDAQGGA